MRPRTAALLLPSALILLALALSGQAPQQPPADPGAAAPGQPPGQITLELNRGGALRKMKLAMPAFRGSAGAGGRELESVVRQDLEVSGYFEIQGPDAARCVPNYGMPAVA